MKFLLLKNSHSKWKIVRAVRSINDFTFLFIARIDVAWRKFDLVSPGYKASFFLRTYKKYFQVSTQILSKT